MYHPRKFSHRKGWQTIQSRDNSTESSRGDAARADTAVDNSAPAAK